MPLQVLLRFLAKLPLWNFQALIISTSHFTSDLCLFAECCLQDFYETGFVVPWGGYCDSVIL